MTAVELVVDAAAEVGEGPLWDPRSGCLYWLDVFARRVHCFDPESSTDEVIDLETLPGSLACRASGGLVVATPGGFCALDPATGELTLLAAVEADDVETRMNDGKVDPGGRFWAGTTGDGTTAVGSLYRLDADLSVHSLVSGVTISNGMGWSPDASTMYYIDTPTKTVDAFDFDVATGDIENRRVLVDLRAADVGGPDGMAMDAEGCLWVATWGSGAVRRFSPDGQPIEEINVPTSATSSCAFAGAGLDELYITTATYTLSDAERGAQPHAGGLFRCRPGVRGLPVPEFAG